MRTNGIISAQMMPGKEVMMLTKIEARLVAVCCLLFLASAASAQQASGITGVVTDTSGAVLPGVTVEAASPALIEKVRTVVTDNAGRYRVIDLRSGTYAVTFSLPGFASVKREGIELTAGFTASVDAEMRVANLAETVTVAGTSPQIDTQSVRQQQVLEKGLIEELPTGTTTLSSFNNLIPGLSNSATTSVGTNVGGAGGLFKSTSFSGTTFHDKRGAKMLFDGMRVNPVQAAGDAIAYIINPAAGDEITIQTGGQSAESNATGAVINLIPSEGGNVFRSDLFGLYTNSSLQSNNLRLFATLNARVLTVERRAGGGEV